MNREQAQSERDRMADEHPEATWLVAEQGVGDWAVVRVALASGDSTRVESTEERPAPPFPSDPRSGMGRNTPYGGI